MAKKRRIKKNLVEQILDKADIPYETIVFSGGMQRNQSELDAYGLTDHDIYKTLALEGNVTGPVIGIVPVDDHLNEKKLAAVSGNKRVDMIPTKDLQKTTGYVHGANNPVGIWQTKKFPIYFDDSAKQAGMITISAGEIGRSIRIDAVALAEFVHGQFAPISTDE
ncbi:aminoacyl-tRNA deacylase [Weissella hellenica]|uniref:Cys-tRNA(Pro)/Cys-tRNA(Cys) deacylase n=1 Tax=Weissella hellenica TaxID=46256 RepID=A0A4Y4G432_WEIHE|nr:aminoacyl-tRNA deacylase [Weissella hellenica]NKY66306.1 aminoacyl-tRNA deacylase [Weissella hellenica]GED36567.1 Cys-tRNA(Pro)/Cys-tRNA(Cys) deacylase [Weissella hellenica]SCC11121.1 Cys-tRNA(Pro)/Cys-tRNA(Cys) deacylase [Weissella hellenica]